MKPRRVNVQTAAGTRSIVASRDDTSGQSLADLLRRHAMPLNTRCGQHGLCDSCTVELLRGSVEHVRSERRITAEVPVDIQACEYRPDSDDVEIHIPQRAMLAHAPHVVDDFAVRISTASDPLVATKWAVAIDVGTTTVALLLVEPATGRVAARASAFNAQIHLGDDVVTRITLCMNDPAMVRRMQTAILNDTIGPLLEQALNAAGAVLADVGAFVIAGNTTMLHLLVGADPTPLGVAPFTPRFLEHRVLQAGDLPAGWSRDLRDVPVHLLPGAAAYIGSDVIAGLIATGMAFEPETALLVDLGTNGEIVLRHGDRLFACATAAGPAFEGSRLSSGMRASPGAITQVRLDKVADNPRLRWIGDHDPWTKPIGLCGSAYVDFLAEARRAGLLSPVGRFQCGSLAGRQTNGERAYRLATAQGGRAVSVCECDVASLLTAKAAIATGVHLLLQTAHLRPADVQQLFLAGGFGTFLNATNAIAIGLLPDFNPGQIIPVGNAALAGAYLVLLDRSLLGNMSCIARAITPIELNLLPQFQDTYTDMLCLP
jgi:uncharacterized 2Fe-2S/4Fe-4S cluster protein (DUF4445 family)